MATFDFEPKNSLQSKAIEHLMGHLATHKPFLDGLERLRQDYPMMADHSWSEIASYKSIRDPLPFEQEECRQARAYYDGLLTLVMEYGLNSDWAMERIHYGIRNLYILVIGPIEDVFNGSTQYKIIWDDESFPTKKAIEKDILRQFEEQWTEYERKLEEAGLKRIRKQFALGDHMRWVFKRVCLKQSWNQIANSESRSGNDAIRKATQPIIELLGLQEPKLPGGRPRK